MTQFDARATIEWGPVDNEATMTIPLSPLQAAEIAAAKYGFFDVDLRDNDTGKYTIEARADRRTVKATGRTLTQAVEKLLDIFVEDK